MRGAITIAAVVVAVYTLHLIATWMESRGWIYYRKMRGRSGSLSNAFGEVHALLEPARRHEVEVRRSENLEEDESGDPPEEGGRPARS